VGKHQGVPVTPKQIAEACFEAENAGAAMVHIHVRDPKTGKGSRDPALFREVVELVRARGTDVIINLTAGMGGDFVPGKDNPAIGGPGTDIVGAMERLAHVEELLPDVCSLDCGTLNFGMGNEVYINTSACLKDMATRCQELGVKPELEVFDLGQIRLARHLIDEGLIDSPPMFQVCLGLAWSAGADTASMVAMTNALPAGANWFSFGPGNMQMPMAAQAMVLGGNVRVGLEDNLYLKRGVLASNGQLVEKAAHIIDQLGGRVMSPKEARIKLGIKPKR
jgi:uncharacterized protein (DUF849 family)